MNERVEYSLTLIAALGSGLSAGLLFIFSVAIMPALARLQPVAGIAAMQSINEVIQNPVFFLVYFAPALVGLVLAAGVFLGWTNGAALPLLSAAALYLLGVIVVTIAFNVPMNETLAAVDPSSAEGARLWRDYLDRWTAWNHVRALTGIASTVGFMLALR